MNKVLLKSMLTDLDKYNKKISISDFIQKRLEYSIQNYYADLLNTSESLRYRDAIKVMKKMSKGDK